jgi:[ribosomal protein S18]-alanine N-acetyltransferase
MPIEEDLFGPEKWSGAMFWNELAQHHFYLVATDEPGGPVLGYAGLSVMDADESWVQNIAVRRDAQRRGAGRLLLEALLAEAARRGVRKTLLEVAVDNAPAQRLYASHDFEPVGIRRGYYQPSNTDALVMMRDA